jgi:hypothetical protein
MNFVDEAIADLRERALLHGWRGQIKDAVHYRKCAEAVEALQHKFDVLFEEIDAASKRMSRTMSVFSDADRKSCAARMKDRNK